LELIPSIEINTHWFPQEGKQVDVHVLGYFIDPTHDLMQEIMTTHQAARKVQIKAMVEKIAKHTHVKLKAEEVEALSHAQGSLGRPHVAKMLLEKKVVKTISEAFNKYLRSHCPTYVGRATMSPHEAVEAIYESGGVPVIAHPGLAEGVEQLIPELIPYGLCGLEAYHKSHTPPAIEYFCTLAEQYDLIVTGGTDFHGLPVGYSNSHYRLIMPHYVPQRLRQRHQLRHQSSIKTA
jgi:hypothetical protein